MARSVFATVDIRNQEEGLMGYLSDKAEYSNKKYQGK